MNTTDEILSSIFGSSQSMLVHKSEARKLAECLNLEQRGIVRVMSTSEAGVYEVFKADAE